jgi:magnesium chelatase subunit I
LEEERKAPEVVKEIRVYQGGRGGVGVGEGEKGEEEEEEEELLLRRRKTRTERILFPFSAIVGQEVMKRALLLNVINPLIGGVLIEGHRGTAKSVAVRGLIELLPEIEVVEGCRFSCDPAEPAKFCWECREKYAEGKPPITKRQVRVIDLPLNATEDRVVGTLDIERVMREGLRAFEEGILAEANRGILYIDEINLLDDYVVDVLLDAAAMGVCIVEREGVSVSYPANFILVGSMNPEEGKLRPQLLDRLALLVRVKGLESPEDRIKIVELREEFTRNPHAFRKKYEPMQEELRRKLCRARELLPKVELSEDILEVIADVALAFKVDGHRADIMMQRTAQTNAAFEGRTQVTGDDLIMAGNMVLPHRMRKGPLEEEEFNPEHLRELIMSLM